MVGLFKPEVKESLEAMIQQLVSRPIWSCDSKFAWTGAW
jgi:hypothetical protein